MITYLLTYFFIRSDNLKECFEVISHPQKRIGNKLKSVSDLRTCRGQWGELVKVLCNPRDSDPLCVCNVLPAITFAGWQDSLKVLLSLRFILDPRKNVIIVHPHIRVCSFRVNWWVSGERISYDNHARWMRIAISLNFFEFSENRKGIALEYYFSRLETTTR